MCNDIVTTGTYEPKNARTVEKITQVLTHSHVFACMLDLHNVQIQPFPDLMNNLSFLNLIDILSFQELDLMSNLEMQVLLGFAKRNLF